MAREARKDRFTIWPAVLACGFPVVLVLLWSGRIDLMDFGALFLVWSLSALVVLVMAIVSLWARAWRRAISRSILPFATIIMIVCANAVWSFAMHTGERLHFQRVRSSYVKEVSELPTSEPRLRYWDWGGLGFTGHGVVYDESDEVLLPEQSAAWKSRAEHTQTELVCGVAPGKPLGDHFYCVDVYC